MNFEKYLQDFSDTTDFGSFVLNILVVCILTIGLRYYYIHYGRSISDRRKFASIFVPLGLGTLLIISVVQSSIALSLGLVGALSIVRFRAAIKEPEELTFLFLVIGLGLTGGANKPILAIASFVLIVPLLYLNARIDKKSKKKQHNVYLNIKTDTEDIDAINQIVESNSSYVSLNRMDSKTGHLQLNFICQIEQLKDLETIRKRVMTLSSNSSISYIEKPDVIL